MDSHRKLPATAVPWGLGLAGLAGFVLGAVAALQVTTKPAFALLLLLGCTGAPMWWLESRRHPGISSSPATTYALDRRLARLYGLLLAAPVWLLTLQVLPLARGGGVIYGFLQTVGALWPLLLASLLVYVMRVPGEAPTGLELAGRWVRDRASHPGFPWGVLRDQLVKAFFLPLMISFAYEWAGNANPWSSAQHPAWYFVAIAALYLLDTTFAAVGYLSTSRRLDSHIRSSNPYWLGWASALICYPPFFTWLQQAGFNYRDGQLWSDWLPPSHPLFYGWGGAILLLTAIYALSSVVFGIRFSNLTNRGIITHGPYRLTKHPAYLSKNLSWWLISVPFISTAGPGTATLHCAILLGVNGIYWLRAKTEERHLMQDETYRAYAAWIAEHGLFARISRLLARQ